MFFTTTEVVKYSVSVSSWMSFFISSCPNWAIHSTDSCMPEDEIKILLGRASVLSIKPSEIKVGLLPSLATYCVSQPANKQGTWIEPPCVLHVQVGQLITFERRAWNEVITSIGWRRR